MKNNNSRGLIYVRAVKTKDLVPQEKECRKVAKRDSIKIVKIIRDIGSSNIRNPGIREVIRLTILGEIDKIYATSPDRITRNISDMDFLREFFATKCVDLKFTHGDTPSILAVSKIKTKKR